MSTRKILSYREIMEEIDKLDEIQPSIELFGILDKEYKDSMRRLDTIEYPIDPYPTIELPGTKGRIERMRKRNSLGYALWNPQDAKSPLEILSTLKIEDIEDE